MDFSPFYSDFENEIISNLENSKSNRVNGVKKFKDFILDKFEANELDETFDDYTTEELSEILDENRDDLVSWFSNNSKRIYIKDDVSWLLKDKISSHHEPVNSDQGKLLTDEEEEILNMSAGTVNESHYNALNTILQKLESLLEGDKLPDKEAKCALLIAESKFQNKDEEENAKRWYFAGKKNKECGNDEVASQCFKRAGKIYAQCYMYLEAANNLYKAIELIEYSSLENIDEKDRYKKLLVDCRLQYERAGQNQEAAELFICKPPLK